MFGRLKRALKGFWKEWQSPGEKDVPELTTIFQEGDFCVARVSPWWYVFRKSTGNIIDVYALSSSAITEARLRAMEDSNGTSQIQHSVSG